MKATIARILIFLLIEILSINFFNLRQISNKTSARCMDGSSYGFYIYEPEESEQILQKGASKNLLIYFQETPLVWCVQEDVSSTLEKCHKWFNDDEGSMYDFASSKNYAGSSMYLTGILSPEDGIFSNWTKVIIKSCDGGSYLGNRQPVQFKHSKIYFRGGQNVKEAFKYLKIHHYFDSMEQIVLAGSFNGAIGALHWQNYLSSLANIPIKILADAAVFLNEMNYEKNDTVIENRVKMIQKVILDNGSVPNEKCAEKYGDSQWKCLFLENLYPFLNSSMPIFYTQSLYDGWEIREILGFTCAEDFASLSECKKDHKEIIEEYYQNVSILLNNIVQSGSNLQKNEETGNNGVFGIACVSHRFVFDHWTNEDFEVPMKSGNFPNKVFVQWLKSGKSVVRIDEKQWPANSPCANKVVALSQE